MDKVRFSDGSEKECGFVGQPMANKLFVIIPGVSYVEAAALFSNTNNLQEIIFQPANGEPTTFKNFTVLEYLVQEPSGIRAALRIPYVTEV